MFDADADRRIGGVPCGRRSATAGDPKTIVNQILTFEPERMLSLKVYQAPVDFPLPEAVKDMWTVIYFQPLEPGMTNVRIVGLGFTDAPDSQKLKDFFR